MTHHDDPTQKGTSDPSAAGNDASLVGKDLGRYHIIDIVGRGGMGTVYEAVQQNPRRRVALKVLNAGMAPPELLQRFEHEARFLGRLHHPGIAEIYESSTFDLGFGPQPFFAMELVDGETLMNYARTKGLNVRQKLELVIRICETMQHAHQKGVIHRDLKPGNILVVDEGDTTGGTPGQPKILDFGVARTTERDIGPNTARTQVGSFVGTLAYMSVEQASGNPDNIDTRTDVYAVGVIAYELLTGRQPHELRDTPLPQAVNTICNSDPTPLCQANPTLDRDLGIIVGKALEKEKEHRYQSMLEMAQDIQRYLNHEPILAHPPSVRYRLGKFVRRNKVLVSSLATIFVLLIAAVSISSALYFQAETARSEATEARDIAERQAEELEQVVQFQAQQLGDLDTENLGADLREETGGQLQTVLDRFELPAEARAEFEAQLHQIDYTGVGLSLLNEHIFNEALRAIDVQFADQPMLRARLLQTVAHTRRELGLLNEAEPVQQAALELVRAHAEPDHPARLNALHHTGLLRLEQGRHEQAEDFLEQALQGRRQTLGHEHPDTLSSLNAMGQLQLAIGNFTEAEELFKQALEARRQVLGNDHPQTLTTAMNLGVVLRRKGDLDEAERVVRTVTEMRRQTLGENHADTLTSYNNLAVILHRMGNWDEAEQYFRRVLSGQRQALGEDHPTTLNTMSNLATILVQLDKLEEAERYNARALEGRVEVLGEQHPHTLVSSITQAQLLGRLGNPREAETYSGQALKHSLETLGEEHFITLYAMSTHGTVLRDQGELDRAEALGERSVAIARDAFPDDPGSIAGYLVQYGRTLAAQQRFSEAEQAFLEAHDTYESNYGAEDPRIQELAGHLAELYQAWSQVEDSDAHRENFQKWKAEAETDDA